jgi:hypothetical protein
MGPGRRHVPPLGKEREGAEGETDECEHGESAAGEEAVLHGIALPGPGGQLIDSGGGNFVGEAGSFPYRARGRGGIRGECMSGGIYSWFSDYLPTINDYPPPPP